MKKIILSALFVLSSAVTMNAFGILGILNVGARIGIVSSSEQIPTTSDGIMESISAEGTGWTGTIFARLNIPKLPIYIQPELQYTKTTIDLPKFNLDYILGKEEEGVESHKYIDLPVLLGAEFDLALASIRVNAGPVFAITSEKGFRDLVEEDFIAAYNEPKVSWTAGLAVDLFWLTAEIRYNGNFKNDTVNTEDIAGSINPNRTSWNLSFGITF